MSKLQKSYQSLSLENNLLNKRLREVFKFDKKVKGEGRRIHFELEEKLTKAQLDLAVSLERTSELERGLVQIKAELEISLKWTTFSQVLTNHTNQRSNYGVGLGFHNQVLPIISIKNISLS